MGVKDIFHCAGFITRCGAPLPPELFAGDEAECVTALKRAGAVIMGKTVTTEFAFFAPGPTKNPVNPAHTPGGSSSGSAAGVKAGFFTYSLGSQTIGSVIRPAAYCGVTGFKPGFNRISTKGVVPLSPSFDHVGVFCQTPSQLDCLMGVLIPDWQPENPPSAIRLGIPSGPYLTQASPVALDHLARWVKVLAKGGCMIKNIHTLENIGAINKKHVRLTAHEAARIHEKWYQQYGQLYHPKTRDLIEQGQTVSAKEAENTRKFRFQLRREIEDQMDEADIDAWICPSTLDEAPEGLDSTGSPMINLPWTCAGLPVMSIPAATGPSGLPLGIQVVGRFMGDEKLAAAGVVLDTILKSKE